MEQLPVVVAVEQATALNLSDCEAIKVGVTRQHYIQPPTLARSNPPPPPKYHQVDFFKEKKNILLWNGVLCDYHYMLNCRFRYL